MPGTPISVTSSVERCCRVLASVPTSKSTSRSRPTSCVRVSGARSTPKRARASTTSQTATGCSLPFASIGSCSRNSIVSAVARYVVSPDEDPVHGRRGLEPRRGVDDVARRHALTGFGPRGEIDERLARVDSDPHLQLAFLRDPVADRKRSTDGALGIVLTRHRRAEERHHRIADELLHRPTPALQLVAQPLVVGPQDRLHVLRIQLLGLRREADEVGEEDGDDLALSAGFAHPRSV